MNRLYVRNIEQAAAMLELDGQISDGKWENASPQNHWEVWCSAEVVVAGSGNTESEGHGTPAVGRTFNARKDNYNFLDAELLSIVGKRMLGTIRIARVFGLEVAEHLEYATDTDGHIGEGVRNTRGFLRAYDCVVPATASLTPGEFEGGHPRSGAGSDLLVRRYEEGPQGPQDDCPDEDLVMNKHLTAVAVRDLKPGDTLKHSGHTVVSVDGGRVRLRAATGWQCTLELKPDAMHIIWRNGQ